MTEKSQPDLHEALSALKDGETSDWELRKLLQLAEEDPAIYQRWKSYQLIGSSLRRDGVAGVDISSAVSARLAEEKAGVAGWLITARKPLAQTAIAASMAAVAVTGMQQYQIASVDRLGAQADMAANSSNITTSTLPLQLPEGFSLPNLSTQTVSSSNLSPAASPSLQVLSVQQIPVFDREELKQHFENSLYHHTLNASDATQLVLPHARIPQAVDQE